MMRVPLNDPDVPYDRGDFGRCYELLKCVPQWRSQLSRVSKRFPMWRPFVRAWPELEKLYRAEGIMGRGTLDKRIDELLDEAFPQETTRGQASSPLKPAMGRRHRAASNKEARKDGRSRNR